MIEIEVEDPAWRSLEDVEGVVARAAAAALQDHPSAGDRALVVLLTDDEAVRALNARFRAKDQPTNVLAFPAPAGPGASLGDIALAAGVCAREAAAQGKAPDAHLAHLVVHGVLHLLGYDHMEDREAEAMEARERTVLAGLGIADPYGAEARGG
jgi:probable rRNA maturation factor